MEPGGKKAIYWDFEPLPPVATCWLPKAGVHPVLTGYPSLKLTSAPKSGPYGDGRPGDFLLQGLSSEMGQGQEVAECVNWKR